MVMTFLCCRILLFPYLYIWYSSATGQTLLDSMAELPGYCHLCAVSLGLPQLYWFSKMVKGSVKLVSNLMKTKKDK